MMVISKLKQVLQETIQKIENSLPSEAKVDSSSFFQGFQYLKKELIQQNWEQWFEREGTSGPLNHPHPRSRIYRSEPVDWVISDVPALHLRQLLLQKMNATLDDPVKPAAIVFDLDGTLFDVGYRTLFIVHDFIQTFGPQVDNENVISKLRSMEYGHLGYSLAHAMENLGLDMRSSEVNRVFEELEIFWRKKFFDGITFVKHDRCMEGAVEFVNVFCEKGVKIFYLTGRFKKIMEPGTWQQLSQFGFPTQNSTLVTKPNAREDDLEFKRRSFQEIAQSHRVIGNFENEYCNLGAMVPHAPDALHVVVDSQHSGRPVEKLVIPIFRIAHFGGIQNASTGNL